MRPQRILAILAAAWSMTGGAEAQTTCEPLLDSVDICLEPGMQFVESDAVPGLYFVGPIPESDIWRAILHPVNEQVVRREQLRRAAIGAANEAVRHPALVVEVVAQGYRQIAGHEAYVLETTTTPPEGPGLYEVYSAFAVGDGLMLMLVDEMGADGSGAILEATEIVAMMLVETE